MRPVGLDGLDAEMKLGRDPLGPEASPEHFQDLELAVRKLVDGRTHAAFDGLDSLEDQPLAELGADINFVLEDPSQRGQHMRERLGFHHVA